MSCARAVVLAVGLAVGLAPAPAIAEGDPAAAERQYRIARRLAVEGSPEAAAALRRVVELDPQGPLADDALVDHAGLLPLARWPEQIGALDVGDGREALRLLDRALSEQPGGDRAREARYLRALVRLEPLPGRDASAARVDLTAVATGGGRAELDSRARYALAWLLERQGVEEAAHNAYQRLIVDAHPPPVEARARVGLARLLLRRGDPQRAAQHLQEAIEAGAPPQLLAAALRELAARTIVGDDFSRSGRAPLRVDTGIRSACGMAPSAAGGALICDPRGSAVVEIGGVGERLGFWQLTDVQAVAAGSDGRAFAAADTRIYRLEPRGRAVPIGSQGDYGPALALAIDGDGGVFVLERRGQRVGRLRPGAGQPEPYWADRAAKLRDLAWDGRRLVAVDARSRTLVALAPAQTPRALMRDELLRPVGVAADATGRLAVVDAKLGAVRFVNADGTRPEPYVLSAGEFERPAALEFGFDGSLLLLDEEGQWLRVP